MCEHNTESYELTGFFKKNAKKCKKVAKKFGEGKMFAVSLQRRSGTDRKRVAIVPYLSRIRVVN